MPMLVDDKQMQSALQAAAQRPFEGVDPGFFQRFKSDWQSSINATNSNAQDRQRLQLQQEFLDNAFKETGIRFQPWIVPQVGYLSPTEFVSNPEIEASQRKTFDQWKQANPASRLSFPSADEIQQESVKRAQGVQQQSAALARRSTGWGSTLGGLAGGIAGGAADPVNAAAMVAPLGALRSVGILGTALAEGAVNASSEAIIQAQNYDWRKQLDPNFSIGQAAEEVGMAAAGGAIIGGGIKGLARAWQLARGGDWPGHVRDTANVLTREAATPDSRFERSLGGDTAHQAALQKSLDDVASGRPVELPPEAFLQANTRPGRVYDADGRSVGVRYEVVDASDLITSHNDDLSLNPAFPQELQPRDRTRALSQDQINGIAGNLQPERLGFSTDAGNGAPVVGPDGLVESGNGRVMALRRAYQDAGVSAENYRNFLRANNFDVEGIANPVLIARRVTDIEDRVGFVTAANRSTAMRMGAAEQALSDARFIDGPMLDRLEPGDLKAAGNQQFARGFMSKLPRAEQGSLMDAGGFLSQEGERRMTAALMGRAYGEPALLGRALEDTDNNIKSIAGALADSSGAWAKMRDAVARGEIPAGMDVTDDLLDAVKMVMRARDEGRTVSELVNQAEMFGGPNELAKIMARAMFSDEAMKRPVSRARLGEFLRDFADEAMKNDAGPRLLGEPLDAPDILKGSLERVGRNDLLRVAEDRLTPEAVENMARAPETAEAAIMDGERLIADTEAAINRQKRWERESARLLAEKNGEIPNALYHRDIGPIDVIWGQNDPARPNKSFGLAKIAVKHPEVMEHLPGIVDRMNVMQRSENRIRLESDNHRAVVRLDLDGEKKTWLMTAFEYDDRRSGKTTDRSGGFQEDGHSSSSSSVTPNIVQDLGASKPEPVRLDLGDGRGERDLDEIMREADEEIAAGKEIEACTIGKATE